MVSQAAVLLPQIPRHFILWKALGFLNPDVLQL
ncbi:hypothetical protein N879_08495 [Alcaligenes sp. EGD-AK7]|nr:hypothetical protein N879_08495 [Alcaligenes sp. EGD-AK7]